MCPCVNITSTRESANDQAELYGSTVKHLILVVAFQSHSPIFKDVRPERDSGEVPGFRPTRTWVYVQYLHHVR